MTLEKITTPAGYCRFFKISARIYKKYSAHRSTEEDICRMLVFGRSAYFSHASIVNYLLVKNGQDVARFSLLHDRNLPSCVQAAFVEFLPEVENIRDWIRQTAVIQYPGISKIVIGLNAHLNYGAGFLMSDFDKPPVFGLPYTAPYYPKAFQGMTAHRMVSFRFPVDIFMSDRFAFFKTRLDPAISTRYLDMKQLKRDTSIYTYLNNACFNEHPFWAQRASQEDYELFKPFRFLLDETNLIFAFEGDKPVGFLLWYPDFNELVKGEKKIGLLELLHFRVLNPIKTIRFTEVAILPEYSNRPVVLAMIMAMLEPVRRGGYTSIEGGFIFEENQGSMNMAIRFISRAAGKKIEQKRHYALFEEHL